MIKRLQFLSGLFILMAFIAAGVFPMGGKAVKIPMKPYPAIDIPDGLYIHYGNYTAGEKYGDTYMVIKKVKNGNGRILYRVYKDDIRLSSSGKLPADYTNWKSSFLVDPKLGSVLEASENTGSENDDNRQFYHYKFYPDRGYVDFVSKSKKKSTTMERKYRVKVNPEFPAWDNLSMYYALSFLDDRGGGILYVINPSFFKEPLPFYFKHKANETIKTKAGTFHTSKAVMIVADTFLGSLMEPVLKGSAMWVEDSNRRLFIKAELAGYTAFLEDISNVNVK